MQRWPNSAACWSPATPETGTSWPWKSRVRPSSPQLGRTSGSERSGTPNRSSSSGSQRPAPMSNSSVREALDGSVTCSPQSLNSSHESIVPNTARPSRAFCSSPSTLRSSHSILVAEKYGSSTSPVRSRMRSSSPASRSSSQRPAVRRSCHTSARCSGSPVVGSQHTTVSRWLVMPTASSSPGSHARVVERLAGDGVRDLPDLGRVVLDPARAAGSAA